MFPLTWTAIFSGTCDSNAVQGYTALKLAVLLGQSHYACLEKTTRTTSWALFLVSAGPVEAKPSGHVLGLGEVDLQR